MKKNLKQNKIIIATGGTGGHVFPALALVDGLRSKGYIPIFISDKRGKKFFENDASLEFFILPVKNIASNKNMKKIVSLLYLIASFMKAIYIILKIRPVVVIGFGGISSLPAVLMASFLRIPTVIHEQNAVFGRANRFLSNYANLILLSFEETLNISKKHLRRSFVIGVPIREGFIAKKNYDNPVKNSKFIILVIGGSQGAAVFSEIIPKVFQKLSINHKMELKIIHQCRKSDTEQLIKYYSKTNISYEVHEFISNISGVINNSHLVISRSGASTLFEVLASNVPSILIPFKYSTDNHQYVNAIRLSSKEAAWLVEEDKNFKDKLETLLNKIFTSNEMLSKCSNKAIKISRPNASKSFISIIEKYFIDRKIGGVKL